MDKSELPKAFYEAMENLQAIDFALTELTLYLDTHPRDQQALQQYETLNRQRKQWKEKVESMYGPLSYSDAGGGYRWNWADAPWPWQL